METHLNLVFYEGLLIDVLSLSYVHKFIVSFIIIMFSTCTDHTVLIVGLNLNKTQYSISLQDNKHKINMNAKFVCYILFYCFCLS